jgi:hypothetical protein
MGLKGCLSAGAGIAVLAGATPAASQTLSEAISGGTLIAEARARYQTVDQDGAPDNAEALTVRTRLGWETAAWKGFKGAIEFDDVRALIDDYNDAVGPAEPFPVIADPEVTELNRLQISYAASPNATVTVGRQRINFANQRFVGAVAWRQDDQTFDAVRLDTKAGPLTMALAYVDQVGRVFAEAADFESESWLAHAVVDTPSDLFDPSVFVYALDFDSAPALSTITAGASVAGKTTAGALSLAWNATFASQEDYGDNPGAYTLDYWTADLTLGRGPISLKGAYEVLEGDGVRGFSTPLATLHAFNGWADVFLVTPAAGLEDASVTLGYKAAAPIGPFKNIALTAVWHDFEAETTGASLGEEIDLQATAAINPKFSVIAKYADYDGVPGFASREKLWLGFEVKH